MHRPLLNNRVGGEASIWGTAYIAMSFRDLGVGYTGDVVLLRRDSDNAEMAFGFNSGELDTAAILAWSGSDSVYLKRWYNQGTWGHYMEQTNNGTQPLLVNAGVLVTQGGKPSLHFAGEKRLPGDWSATETYPAEYSGFVVADGVGANSRPVIRHVTASGDVNFQRRFSNNYFRHSATGVDFATGSQVSGQRYSFVCHRRKSPAEEIDFTWDGVSAGAAQYMNGDWSSAQILIGFTVYRYQEIIYFPTDLKASEEIYINDQNSFYSIF